jgi:hypothetical protein
MKNGSEPKRSGDSDRDSRFQHTFFFFEWRVFHPSAAPLTGSGSAQAPTPLIPIVITASQIKALILDTSALIGSQSSSNRRNVKVTKFEAIALTDAVPCPPPLRR